MLSEKETSSSIVKYKEPIDDTCPNETYEVGPLLQTEWGQDEGYNNDAPNYNCAGTANDRALTGCVATAIAQVMRYQEHPATYDWDIMPNSGITATQQPYGTEEIAELMRDVGDAVDMKWGCPASGGSGAYTSDGEAALENIFNYSSSVDYQSYDRNKIKQELDYNRPVVLDGYDTETGGGHAWVTDGYRETYTYSDDCSQGWGYLHFHMNWGWEGDENGWYSFDNFNPSNYQFNENNRQLDGIQP